MATSQIVKSLETGAGNGARRQTQTYIAGGTIAAGDVVSWDTSASHDDRNLKVVKCTIRACIGSALAAATAGERVEVVIKGYAEDVAITGAITLGESLGSDAAGALTDAAGGATNIQAVALEAGAAGSCDVCWL